MKHTLNFFRALPFGIAFCCVGFLSVGPASAAPAEEVAIFAGGCSWGVEAVFRHVKGVTEAVAG